MRKSYVYLVWGKSAVDNTTVPLGLYKKEDDAWKRFSDVFSGEKKLKWKWVDVKKMELK